MGKIGMGVILGIAVLGFLILVHELGHFLAARLQGIHANRFSIGFGPALFTYKSATTEYALRALPLGGYVGFPDEDPDCPYPADDPNLLKNRPILDRAIVMVAGVVANLIFTYVPLLLLILLSGVPEPLPGAKITSISEKSPAATAGIEAGDVVRKVNAEVLGLPPAGAERFQQMIKAAPGQPLALEIERAGQTSTVTVTPSAEGRIGVSLTPNSYQRAPKDLLEPLTIAGQRFWFIASETVANFGQLFTGKVGLDQFSSPVGIVNYTAKVADADILNVFTVMALISFSLAFINILPIPGLDGSHLAFLALEGLRGKPISQVIQMRVLQTGLVFLMGLSVVLILKDSITLIMP